MSTAEATTLHTPEDLLAMPDAGRYELVDGQLVEREMSQLSSWVAGKLGRRVGSFVDDASLGWVMDAECGYQCFAAAPKRVRRPDASFIRKGRLPAEQPYAEGHVPIAPDWAAEVVSPNESAYHIEHKIQEYLQAGVRLIWIVYPETRSVMVVRADGSADRLDENDELSGEDVIPGFRCRVSDLFPPAFPEAHAAGP